MALCRNCGAETPRVTTYFTDQSGNTLPEPRDECPGCHPEMPVLEPKLELTPYHVAHPDQYDTLAYDDGEYVPIVKDWARGEFEQLVATGPVAQSEEDEAIERKRAFARERDRFPLTEGQIQQRKDYIRDQMEQVERMMSAEAAGLVLP
jgi:hypothetical protein